MSLAHYPYLSFQLDDEFVEGYANRPVRWGYPCGGSNSFGEITFLSKYSRLITMDGVERKERYFETCRRVIEGMFSIIKDHCKANRTPWRDDKGLRKAHEAYERLFEGKWSPPGRGWWMMGTPFVSQYGSAALQNCAAISTRDIDTDFAKPFALLHEMSMLGIGVGFDTRGKGTVKAHLPKAPGRLFIIPDSREGWVDSTAALLRCFVEDTFTPVFDYSKIRPAGSPIRGFGGIAAGPGPLIALHDRLDHLLTGLIGQTLSGSTIVDIANMIGRCTVAGNVRSSAEIALDDGDEEFLDLKDWNINPERMDFNTGWGHLSNNSVLAKVGTDYSHLVPRIANNGEPGLIYLDLMRSFGRMIDPPDYKDEWVMGVNPCLPASVRLLTREYGLRSISGLTDRNFTIWNGVEWTPSTAWHSGVKPVWRMNLTNGQSIEATEDHRFAVWAGGDDQGRGRREIEMTLGNITRMVNAGQKVRIRPLVGSGDWDSPFGPRGNDAILLGLMQGDGSYTPSNGNPVHIKNKEPEVLRFLRSVIEDTSRIRDPIAGEARTSYLPGVAKLAEDWEIDLAVNLPFRALPGSFFSWHPDSMRAFLCGLFSANGGAMPQHNRIDLKTFCKELSQQVQLALIALGYPAYITTNKSKEVAWWNGTFTSLESYDVNIAGHDNYGRFQREIGFLHQHKSQPGLEKAQRPSRATSVASVEFVGVEDVYDFAEPATHWGWANGMKVHNCAEMPLESAECCTLAESYPMNCTSKADYLRSLKFAFMYGKAVTLLNTHWPEVNEVMVRNRRIGVSMTGLALFVETHGWRDLQHWCDEGYHTLKHWDEVYSRWLGIRNSVKISTIKPGGTVPLLLAPLSGPGNPPGVHWPVKSGEYIRRMRASVSEPIIAAMAAAGYNVEPNVMNPDHGRVIDLPVMGPVMRDERSVPLWEKVSLAELLQRYWSDNSVSATFTFLPEEKDQIASILRVFEGRLKSLSFLPLSEEGGPTPYPQMPMESVSHERWQEIWDRTRPLDWDGLYMGDSVTDASGEKFCATDQCMIQSETAPIESS